MGSGQPPAGKEGVASSHPNSTVREDAAVSQPRYLRLAEELRSLVKAAGEHQSLPSERALSERYAVSRDTVRRAVRCLEDQGLIYSGRGRGTYAAPKAVRRMSGLLYSFSQDARLHGATPGQRILFFGMAPASRAASEALGLAANVAVMRVRRVRLIDSAPVGIQDAFLNLPAGVELSATEFAQCGSLYDLIARQIKVSLVEALDVIRAASADEEDAAVLGVAVGSPLLVSERTTLSDRREPFEFCEMRYLPAYRYSNRLTYQNAIDVIQQQRG